MYQISRRALDYVVFFSSWKCQKDMIITFLNGTIHFRMSMIIRVPQANIMIINI